MARVEWVMEQWTLLCHDIGVTEAVEEKWDKTIRMRYSEEGRHYHTLEHVADMLEGADRDFKDVRNSSVVRLAIFFHDLVYNPRSGTNEEDSEEVFQRFAKEVGLGQSRSEAVSRYIIATKNHDVVRADDSDLRAFIDLDMGVIGRERAGYLKYAAQIRSEYIHVPTETFCRKRVEFLRQLLGMGHVYATNQYRRNLEATARANIEAEIALLEAEDLAPFGREAVEASA